MNYQPFGSNVLLRRKKVSEQTKAGVIKGELAERQEKAEDDGTLEVVAIGSKCLFAKIGNNVFIRNQAPYDVIPLLNNDNEYVQVDEYNLLGVLTK